MNARHTLGPLQYGFKDANTAFIVEPDGITVAVIRATANTTAASTLAGNVVLWAAAAETLEAAREALTCMDGMLRNGEWYAAQEKADALRAAIAKATGNTT